MRRIIIERSATNTMPAVSVINRFAMAATNAKTRDDRDGQLAWQPFRKNGSNSAGAHVARSHEEQRQDGAPENWSRRDREPCIGRYQRFERGELGDQYHRHHRYRDWAATRIPHDVERTLRVAESADPRVGAVSQAVEMQAHR